MERDQICRQRGQAVLDLLAASEEIKTLGQLAKKLRSDPREKKNLENWMRRRTPNPNKNGEIRLLDPLSFSLCKEIAEVFGTQASSIYIELLPEEAGEPASPRPTTKKATRTKKAKPPPPAPTESGPTFSHPALGLKNQPITPTLVQTSDGLALQFQFPLPLETIQKLLEGKK